MQFGIDWPVGFREENNGYIHVYSPVTGADNPLGSNYFSLTVLFSQYSPLLQVFLN